MTFVVCGEVDMLTKIERREERQKLRGESVCKIIEMNVKVTGDDKFMGRGCAFACDIDVRSLHMHCV